MIVNQVQHFFQKLLSQVIVLLVGGLLVIGLQGLSSRATASSQAVETAAVAPAVVQDALVAAQVLHYQGRLLEPATGAVKPDGVYPMTFQIYTEATGGAALWAETKNVSASQGRFTTLLGDTTPLNLAIFTGQELYLGVQVGTDLEATPRQRIAHVAYALFAENADTVDGLHANAFANASHSHPGADIVDGSIETLDLANNAVTAEKMGGTGASPGQFLNYNGASVAWSTLPADGLLQTRVFNVTCTRLDNFSTNFAKLLDVGTFTKADASSTMEVTFNGRIAVTVSMAGTGARFELRVDDLPSASGPARASIKAGEVGVDGVQASIMGIFTGVAAGTHTVSIWVQGANGSGQSAMVDPGCWSSDHVVVKELK